MTTPRPGKAPTSMTVTQRFIGQVVDRLEAGQRVRRRLPGWGRLAVDRQLPFLCVYRRPARRADAGTDRLVTSEASYLTCAGTLDQSAGIRALVRALSASMVDAFGACLVIEIWSSRDGDAGRWHDGPPEAAFRLVAPRRRDSEQVTKRLVHAFGQPRVLGNPSVLAVSRGGRRAPRGLPPLLDAPEELEIGAHLYGLEVAPIFRDPGTGDPYPEVLRELRRVLSLATRRMVFEFATEHTAHRPASFHALGRRAVVRAVWESDRRLADVSQGFDPLLLVTPVNAEASWHTFRRDRFQSAPTFYYRPLPADPVVLKRAVWAAPVERIEDPALARVFREKQSELDRQITLVESRDSDRFLASSIQLFGEVDDDLHDLALTILASVSPRARASGGGRRSRLSAERFADAARAEIRALQGQDPTFSPSVSLRDDVAGVMVSRGDLLISTRASIPVGRVEALLQHEVGTHALTYHNGRAQRLRLLASGLAGYDALQEGLAVLAEALVGGLDRARLRLLAGRVVAVRGLLDGASFVDTFDELTRVHGFPRQTAFSVAMRTHRGGGLTKDALYLQGLQQVLALLRAGGELDPLWAGKFAVHHEPLVRELQWRGLVRPAPLRPRYLDLPTTRARLAQFRQAASVLDLCRRTPR